ncbi:MAG: rhodanese-like domain-containing protein [Bacteroidota bacterium]|nr:rhodanese-like domain-containing protein [Bacteroidota bacterium]
MSKYSLTLENFKDYQKENLLILDTRKNEDFALGFIPKSINIELKRGFKAISKHFLLKDQALLIIASKGQEEKAIIDLRNFGFTNIKGYLKGGFESWRKNKLQIDIVISINPEELYLEKKHGKLFLIDIRPKNIYEKSQIEGSQNIDTKFLINNYQNIEDEVTNCIYCHNGSLSLALISYLKRAGKHNIYHVSNGFNGILKNKKLSEMISSNK